MPKVTSALLLGLSLLAVSTTAYADDDDEDMPPPQAMPGPAPVYQAPLAQTTQSTYVPQSVALSGPEEITDNTDGRPAPAGYTSVKRSRKGLLIGGGVTLGATYGLSALIAAAGDDFSDGGTNEVAALWIPVAGPFIQIANTESATAKVFLVGLGAAQVAGAVMLYYGLTTTKTVFVRNDLVGSLNVGPMVGDGTTGMSLSGRF